MNTIHTNLRDYLQEHGSLTYRFSGVSMLPMLRQNKDLVTIVPYDGRGLKKYDAAVYDRGGSRRYVLHRVVAVHEDDRGRSYTFLGDNLPAKELRVPDAAIVAVLTSFDRDGRVIPVENRAYRFYSRAWYFLFPMRRFFMLLRRRLARVGFLRRLYHLLKRRT